MEVKTLAGTSPGGVTPLEIDEDDIIGENIAILTMKDVKADYCFNDGRYNNSDFEVEQSMLTSSNFKEYTAYTIQSIQQRQSLLKVFVLQLTPFTTNLRLLKIPRLYLMTVSTLALLQK